MLVACGAEVDVPETLMYDEESFVKAAHHVPTPIATTSGFVRPSNVGPLELKLAIVPLADTAPIANAPNASEGGCM